MDNVTFVAEWFFEQGGAVMGPYKNAITAEGLVAIAGQIKTLSSPYLVVGDDESSDFTIGEVFRKPVSAITQDGNLVRYRTQLLTGESNGDHQKVSIYVEAADSPGTGIMLNQLKRPWSKAQNTILTVECRISVL